jgi:hypothetical protein
MSAMHFAVTGVGLRVLCAFGVFEYQPAKIDLVFMKAILDCGSVGLMNLNLAHNSVGIFQVSPFNGDIRATLDPSAMSSFRS